MHNILTFPLNCIEVIALIHGLTNPTMAPLKFQTASNILNLIPKYNVIGLI